MEKVKVKVLKPFIDKDKITRIKNEEMDIETERLDNLIKKKLVKKIQK